MELRDLPKVDALSRESALSGYPVAVRTAAARGAVAKMRAMVQAGKSPQNGVAIELAVNEAESLVASSLVEVINASGVILHTGIGRARLAPSVQRRLSEVAGSHVATEIDLASGERGDRQDHVRALLLALTSAEDAHVVNNCAAAVLLALCALCAQKEVILSRGQMIEIGGSFRMPDIVRQSGCRLVEVGCTNKTHVFDYEDAITEETAAILRCHPSNYRVVGFTQGVSAESLRKIADEKGLLIIDDMGNGCLIDIAEYGLPHETTLPEAVAAGADVVTASADKLLGGPQAGIILGRKEAIAKIRKHPLARAVRVDKLTLTALEETLRLYSTGRQNEIPTLAYLSKPLDSVKRDAQRLKRAFKGESLVSQGFTEVGGGSAPGAGIPTWRLGLKTADPIATARKLRTGRPAILTRIERDIVWLDPRTIDRSELLRVEKALSLL
ncbi:MAG: L-seryl-tRNA(Sec) selenium transferase [Fimbriimonadaceae bacterium]|nr:L-seryl-tRNA(Sec) selenium transferase [Fimbriimonadaceae bacterium]